MVDASWITDKPDKAGEVGACVSSIIGCIDVLGVETEGAGSDVV